MVSVNRPSPCGKDHASATGACTQPDEHPGGDLVRVLGRVVTRQDVVWQNLGMGEVERGPERTEARCHVRADPGERADPVTAPRQVGLGHGRVRPSRLQSRGPIECQLGSQRIQRAGKQQHMGAAPGGVERIGIEAGGDDQVGPRRAVDVVAVGGQAGSNVPQPKGIVNFETAGHRPASLVRHDRTGEGRCRNP